MHHLHHLHSSSLISSAKNCHYVSPITELCCSKYEIFITRSPSPAVRALHCHLNKWEYINNPRRPHITSRRAHLFASAGTSQVQIRAIGYRSKSPQHFMHDWCVPSQRQTPEDGDNIRATSEFKCTGFKGTNRWGIRCETCALFAATAVFLLLTHRSLLFLSTLFKVMVGNSYFRLKIW